MTITPTRTLLRRGLLAFVLSLVISFTSMIVRFLHGVITVPYFFCALLALVILFTTTLAGMMTAYRVAERRGKSLRFTATVSLLAAVPITIAMYLVEYAVIQVWPEIELLEPNEPTSLGYFLTIGFSDSLPMLVLWAGLFLFPTALSAQEDRQKELTLLRREADILRLRSHLEPHFVLNTLNAVSGFVIEDPPQAHELLAALGDLFRDASTFSPKHRVADEIAWLRRYVTIHELRHPELLRVEWDVASEALEYACPALIAQPLVENGIMHGALRSRPSRLKIRVAVEETDLVVEVRDNGPALGPRREGGKGLSIVERRLRLEGSDEGALRLHRNGDETVACIRLPARVAAPAKETEVTHAL